MRVATKKMYQTVVGICGGLLLAPALSWGQAAQSCEDQLQHAKLELSVADMQLRQMRQGLTTDMLRMNTRADNAETRAVQAEKALEQYRAKAAQSSPPNKEAAQQ